MTGADFGFGIIATVQWCFAAWALGYLKQLGEYELC